MAKGTATAPQVAYGAGGFVPLRRRYTAGGLAFG
jgi:hypothetical protein